jgi:hypothetical protein
MVVGAKELSNYHKFLPVIYVLFFSSYVFCPLYFSDMQFREVRLQEPQLTTSVAGSEAVSLK